MHMRKCDFDSSVIVKHGGSEKSTRIEPEIDIEDYAILTNPSCLIQSAAMY